MRVLGGDDGPVAAVLPGRAYGPHAPLLHFATLLLVRRGWRVRVVEWADAPPQDAAQVREHLTDAAGDADDVLVVAKSLGTLALPLAAERGWAGVWLTPLLREDAVVRALAALRAPALLVGGAADPLWDGEIAARCRRELGHEVLELPGADHSLEDPGDEAASLGMLTTVVRRAGDFVDRLDRQGSVGGRPRPA